MVSFTGEPAAAAAATAADAIIASETLMDGAMGVSGATICALVDCFGNSLEIVGWLTFE